MKSCYHLIKTMTKFETQTSHWLYFFIKKKTTVDKTKKLTTAHLHDACFPVTQA